MNPDIEAAHRTVEYLSHAFATNSRDWGKAPDDAWLFGVVCGWDEATPDLIRDHGWTPEQVELLNNLHAGFLLLPDLLAELGRLRAGAGRATGGLITDPPVFDERLGPPPSVTPDRPSRETTTGDAR